MVLQLEQPERPPIPECVVSRCWCCGCPLPKGALNIAIFNLIGNLINFGVNTYFLASIPDLAHHMNVYAYATIIATTVFAAVGVFINGLLVAGTVKSNIPLVMGWVWSNTVVNIINLVLAIVLVAMGVSIPVAVNLFVTCALNVYFIVVVRSFAFELMAGTNAA